jgi:hypothetical protein
MNPATCTFLFDFPFCRADRFTRRQTLRDVLPLFFSACDSARFPEGRNKEASKKTFRSPPSRVRNTRNLQTTRELRLLRDFRRACSTHYTPRFPAAPPAFFLFSLKLILKRQDAPERGGLFPREIARS